MDPEKEGAAAKPEQPLGRPDKVREALLKWAPALTVTAVAVEKVYDLLKHIGLGVHREPTGWRWRRGKQ